MKKGKLTLGIVLGLLVIGFVVAQAQAVSAQDSGVAPVEEFTLRSGGSLYLDHIGWCNDAKFSYQSVGGGMYSLTGYEYGCGYDDRLIFGSMRVVGNTLQIGYTTICGVSCYTPYMGQVSAQISIGGINPTYSGPLQWAWHYDGYHYEYGTAQLVSVGGGATAVVSAEPDSAE